MINVKNFNNQSPFDIPYMLVVQYNFQQFTVNNGGSPKKKCFDHRWLEPFIVDNEQITP